MKQVQESQEIHRSLIYGCRPFFQLPRNYSDNIYLKSTDQIKYPSEAENKVKEKYDFCLEFSGINADEIHHLSEMIRYGILLASDCGIRIGPNDTWILHEYTGKSFFFPHGHEEEELTEDAFTFSAKHFRFFSEYWQKKQFNRLSNAMQLHLEAMDTTTPFFALLGFVGALESLFSVSLSELSFRLSLMIGKFLGDTRDEQEEYFKKVKNLYKMRSKIAHGDSINKKDNLKSLENLHDMLPVAEGLLRKCIRKIIDGQMMDIFEPEKRLVFLNELIFSDNVMEALEATRRVHKGSQ